MWGFLALSRHLGGLFWLSSRVRILSRLASQKQLSPPPEKTIERANPGQHMAAAFRKCGLFPVDPSKAIKRILSRDMDAPETIRELLNPNQGEKLDQI
jgi:hypothetical protein